LALREGEPGVDGGQGAQQCHGAPGRLVGRRRGRHGVGGGIAIRADPFGAAAQDAAGGVADVAYGGEAARDEFAQDAAGEVGAGVEEPAHHRDAQRRARGQVGAQQGRFEGVPAQMAEIAEDFTAWDVVGGGLGGSLDGSHGRSLTLSGCLSVRPSVGASTPDGGPFHVHGQQT